MKEAKHRVILLMDDEALAKLQSSFKLAQTLEEYQEASMGEFIVDAIEAYRAVIRSVIETQRFTK